LIGAYVVKELTRESKAEPLSQERVRFTNDMVRRDKHTMLLRESSKSADGGIVVWIISVNHRIPARRIHEHLS
jgi:hypothetical protein